MCFYPGQSVSNSRRRTVDDPDLHSLRHTRRKTGHRGYIDPVWLSPLGHRFTRFGHHRRALKWHFFIGQFLKHARRSLKFVEVEQRKAVAEPSAWIRRFVLERRRETVTSQRRLPFVELPVAPHHYTWHVERGSHFQQAKARKCF